MAELKSDASGVGARPESEVLAEAASLLSSYGFEIVTVPSTLAASECDLVLRKRDRANQDHYYLVEWKTILNSEFVPSSSLSSCADLMDYCRRGFDAPYVTCIYSTNAKLGEAASRLGKERDLWVVPEVDSGFKLASAVRDLAISSASSVG